MDKYNCERCGKTFKQKSHYNSHKNRKKQCDNVNKLIEKKVKIDTIKNLKNILNSDQYILLQQNMVINTFNDVYELYKELPRIKIYKWLTIENKQEAGYRQEASLKLLGSMGCIEKLNNYIPCIGNFNMMTICKYKKYKEFFYDNENMINIRGNSGDSSDFTLISRNNDKEILVISSKNLDKEKSGSIDIEKMSFYAQKYVDKGYKVNYGFCVPDKKKTDAMMERCKSSSKDLVDIYKNINTIVIDHNDLYEAANKFKSAYQNISLDDILNDHKKPACLKMHQQLGVNKTMKLKNNGIKKILWGHIQRSGKSYIIGGSIIEDSKDKDKCNYLVITTAPSETIKQQIDVFDCLQLTDFNIIKLDGEYNKKNKKPDFKEKNIIVCSKQFLQCKIDDKKNKSIAWLKKMNFDMRFIDESHNGGTTELAQRTLDTYGKDAFTVQITATYSKPVNDYDIPKDCWILWDLEDIKLCKNFNDEKSIPRLAEKHGDDIFDILSYCNDDNIINEYSKYPELWLLTDELSEETTKKIVESTRDNNYGWSPEACFTLKNNKNIKIAEFQNSKENLKMWYRIFGKNDEFGIPDKEYSDSVVFINRIEKICKNPDVNSRFIGDTDEPMIIMAFLPQNDIDLISKATIKLLRDNDVLPKYEIISINSKTTKDPKQSIEDARIKAKLNGNIGVLVLSGKQCSLGVSIHNCDIVLLLNNNMGFDMIYQMMFRCMTEGENKKCGFVIDLNIHRVISTSVIEYSSIIKSELHPKEACKYILQERLINLNGDHWMPEFNNDINEITALSKNVYDIYSSETVIALNHYLDRLKFKEILLNVDEQIVLNALFSTTKPTKKQLEKIQTLLEDEDIEDINDNIKKGIEKEKVINPNNSDNESSDDESDDESDDDVNDKKVNYMEILKHIIPLICLLTIHDEESSFIGMFDMMKDNKYIYDILIEQTKSWWGNNIDELVIKKFINIYIKYVKDDKETNQIIRTVKELFCKNVNNSKQLSILIDKYLYSLESEKNSNAEVSTPNCLRKSMLDKIPEDFWKSINKVFEPCCGKCGFLVDIIENFMIGLKDVILDPDERYKTIVEQCLYFCDINPTNIFIAKLLLDPFDKYKLNYHEGNTLELDINKKWNIDGFDAVIGNPPYQAPREKENKAKGGGGDLLWNKFVKKSINDWLNKDGYLVYVHPSGWRKPDGLNVKTKSKYDGLYNLMTKDNHMIYLNINDTAEGIKVFKCGTRFDWYIIQKCKNNDHTTIIDEDDIKYICDLKSVPFLPNKNIKYVTSIISCDSNNNIKVLRPGSDPRRDYISDKKDDDFKYTLIYSTPKRGTRYKYSNIKKDSDHFGIKKFIFGDSGISEKSVIDKTGDYGIACHSIGIELIEDFEDVKKYMLGDEFSRFIDSCSWSNYQLDWRLFTYLKKEFWK